MRQRITYIHASDDGFTPQKLRVTSDSIAIRSLRGAKEQRLTLSLSELLPEFRAVLDQCQELHVRWASPHPYKSSSPFLSRVTPGIHISFLPKNEEGNTSDVLCSNLRRLFSDDLKCHTPVKSFSTPPIKSYHTKKPSPLQYYAYISSLHQLVDHLRNQVCNNISTSESQACHHVTSSLESASSLDFDYDVNAAAVTIGAYWDSGPNGQAWNDKIENSGGERMEVGILNIEKADEAEEIGLGGWLTVVGDDDKPKPTLFSFPSRHHSVKSRFQAQFLSPTGLHPTMIISMSSIPNPPARSCALHAYLTLPSAVFIDRYAFTDPLFLKSHNLAALRTLSGATDLEAPDWAVPTWGSAALFELATSNNSNPSTTVHGTSGYTVTIPLHSRYMTPAHNNTHTTISIPYPNLFWSCPVAVGGSDEAKLSINPFDRTHLGYDTLFGERTLFYHLEPVPSTAAINTQDSGKLLLQLDIPILDTQWSSLIEYGTAITVLLGTAWVLWHLVRPMKDGKAFGTQGQTMKASGKKDE